MSTMIRKIAQRSTSSEKTPVKPAGAPERDDVYRRNKDNPYGLPADHVGHDAYWTGAEGVFYCHTCEDWFRTWGETA